MNCSGWTLLTFHLLTSSDTLVFTLVQISIVSRRWSLMILVTLCHFFCKISQQLFEEPTWNLIHTSMSPSGSIHPISVSAYPEQGHPGQVTSSSQGWHIKIIVVWENRDTGKLCYELTVLLLPLCTNCINFSPHFLSSTVKIICIKAGTEDSRLNVSQVMEQVMLLNIEKGCSNFHPKI